MNKTFVRRPPVPLVVTGLVVYWLAVVVAMHLLEREFDPLTVPISVYVLGTYGAWMTTSFFAGAAIWFLLAFGFRRALPPTFSARAGIVLLCIAGCGEIVMGLSPTQYPVTPPFTQQTLMHLLGAVVAFNAIALGSISLSVSFRGAAQWRSVSTATLIVSLLMFAMLQDRWLWHPELSASGLKERVIVALMLLWFALAVSPWIWWSRKAETAEFVGTG